MDLGFHNSGDIVSITILDADSGLELEDDVLYSTRVRVPWCSAFHADVVTARCKDGHNYECDLQVSEVTSFCPCSANTIEEIRAILGPLV